MSSWKNTVAARGAADRLCRKVGSENGVVRFSHSLPVQSRTQIEVRRIELRTDGDCVNLDAKDFEDGSAMAVSAGAAVVVSGIGGD